MERKLTWETDKNVFSLAEELVRRDGLLVESTVFIFEDGKFSLGDGLANRNVSLEEDREGSGSSA
jgi:hypothetical protein